MNLRIYHMNKWKPAIKNGQQKNIHENTNTQTHKHTNTQTHKQSNTHTQKSSTNNKIFYHRVYHPKDITNATIQWIYHQCFKNIPDFQNIIICSSRPRNLQDIHIPLELRNIPLQNPSDVLKKI